MKNINGVDYNQLCVMEGTLMPEGGAEELVKFFKDEMGVNVHFETQVKTLPDETGEGGRNDLFFYIADNDISSLQYQDYKWVLDGGKMFQVMEMVNYIQEKYQKSIQGLGRKNLEKQNLFRIFRVNIKIKTL